MPDVPGKSTVTSPPPPGRDLTDAEVQFAAISEVLSALGRSASAPDIVLDTIVESARRLCRADAGQIFLVDGDVFCLARAVGLSPEYRDYIEHNPLVRDQSTLTGRVGIQRRTQQITDVLADPDYGRMDVQRMTGVRTAVGAPMLLDDEVVGVLLLWRTEVDAFDERALSLLTAFAAQAAIVSRHVDLLRTLEARSTELARRVGELEALREVGEAVSSSLDLDEVLCTIVQKAVELTGTDGGSMMEFDEDDQQFFVRTAYGTSDDLLDALRRTRIDPGTTLVGRAAMQARPLQVQDLQGVALDPHLKLLHDAGWRSLVAVPMVRDGKIVGALVVRRLSPGGFSEQTCELLQTFASQSALAILNARLFRQLERQSSELASASRHKSEFLASMSHELRTPLNAVIGFSEVLLERMFGDLTPRQEEYLRDIWDSGRHLLELINEILDLSKVEAGAMDLHPSPFSIRAALEGAISLVRERATQHGVELKSEIAVDADIINSDELRFKQVVLNLLTNAVKFTPDGGEVTVRAEDDGGELAVTVTDTGIGVDPADQERIFESFQQGGRRPSRQEGTGLGLTLSRRIADLLGGRLWVESEVGVGSTFGFAIPHTPNVTGSMRENQTRDRTDVPVVVVVEDDRPSLDLIAVYAEDAGFQVVSARDGAAGLEAVRRLQPFAVVLDIGLPDIDGWEVLATLKADPKTAAVPIIVVSILDERAKGMALGAAEYLVKPIHRGDFRTALEQVRPNAPAPDNSLAGADNP